ncbi:MAG TPA: Cof-type HAD-IIB family hydrolase [Pseudolabrys sp.]|nr:Cof-type HAD-IIB family hydrolase [Pseudolabrys sp.]
MVAQTRRSGKLSLVIADVDGTLLTEDKVLTPRARDAVHALHRAGIGFAITSGRPPRGMAMLIEPLALRTPIAGFNGGEFVTPQMATVEEHRLPPDTARRAADMIRQHKLDLWVYTDRDWLIRDGKAPHVGREQHTVQFPPQVVDDLGAAFSRAIKLVGVSDDHDAVARCESDLQATLGEQASASRSQPYYVDVTHPLANKGTVVETLAKLLATPKEQIVTIGDMPNDTLMFRKSGLSIAMGQADDAVKAQARCVTASNREDGFAKAMEQFVLDGAAAA